MTLALVWLSSMVILSLIISFNTAAGFLRDLEDCKKNLQTKSFTYQIDLKRIYLGKYEALPDSYLVRPTIRIIYWRGHEAKGCN